MVKLQPPHVTALARPNQNCLESPPHEHNAGTLLLGCRPQDFTVQTNVNAGRKAHYVDFPTEYVSKHLSGNIAAEKLLHDAHRDILNVPRQPPHRRIRDFFGPDAVEVSG